MKATKIVYCLTIALVSVCTCNALASESGTPLPIPTIDAAASVGYFYVGGRYVGDRGAQVMQGAMYVEVLRPKHAVYDHCTVRYLRQVGAHWGPSSVLASQPPPSLSIG